MPYVHLDGIFLSTLLNIVAFKFQSFGRKGGKVEVRGYILFSLLNRVEHILPNPGTNVSCTFIRQFLARL